MKKSICLLSMLISVIAYSLDYSQLENWVVCENEASAEEATFDIFYCYPTLVADKVHPLMEWKDNAQVAAKTLGFVRAQTTDLWHEQARVFAPYVRQVEFFRCCSLLKAGTPWEESLMSQGIKDLSEAFDYYLKHFNHGRPFILLGHSQGAMDLYCVLKNCKTITVEQGFVAAYLLGLPNVTYQQFAKDFQNRAIVPARGASDLGVVIGWNTQNKTAGETLFSGPDRLCINPLNWCVEEAFVPAKENRGAGFYDYQTGKTLHQSTFCGAQVDLKRGALIVDLPTSGQYDAKGLLGEGVFHMNDFWFFSENIRLNVHLRVHSWKKYYGHTHVTQSSEHGKMVEK